MRCRSSCCVPISPHLCCHVGAGAAPPAGEHGVVDVREDVPGNQEHAVFGDPVIGPETVLENAKGPGALEATSVQTQTSTTAAQWARHRLTHLQDHSGQAAFFAWRAAEQIHNTADPMRLNALHPSRG